MRALLTRLGQEHKLTFFSSRPLLLEGPSDAIIVSGLDRHLDLYLEAAGAQPVPVIGKGQMSVVAKLMRMMGKTPVVLADADGFTDSLDLIAIYAAEPSANAAAQMQGHSDLSAFARVVHSDFCKLVDNSWDDLAQYATAHRYWLNQETSANQPIAKRRAAFASLMSMNEDERLTLHNAISWTAMFHRLTALLNFLETSGCFFLRRGTIESYYQFGTVSSAEGKPIAAVEEVEGFTQQNQTFAEAQYKDILRALRFVSATQPLNEALALRELLLAITAPALAMLSSRDERSDPNILARKLVGEKASLVDLSVDYTNSSTPELVIRLQSKVLSVEGFPLRLPLGCNPITEIDRQLNIVH